MREQRETTHERRARCARAFDAVMQEYEDLRNSGQQLLNSVRSIGGIVAPNKIDFLCDVDIAVKRSGVSQELFLDVYVNQSRSVDTVDPFTLARFKERVGQFFILRRIFPVGRYFKGIEVTRGVSSRN